MGLTRRSWLRTAGITSLTGGLLAKSRLAGQSATSSSSGAHPKGHGHAMGLVGQVSSAANKPGTFLRSWNFSDLPPEQRASVYRESRRPDGSLLREYEI